MAKCFLNSNFFIYLGLLCLGINYLLYNALGIDQYKTIFRVFGIMFMIIKWCLSLNTKIDIMQALLFIVAVAEVFIYGLNAANLLALVIIGLAVGEELTGVNKIFKINLLLFLVVLLFLMFGFMHNVPWYGGTDIIRKVRWTLGFLNPNHASSFFTAFFCLFIITRDKLKKWHVFAALAVESYIFYLTDSRTWFIAYIVFSVIIFSISFLGKRKAVFQDFCIILTDFIFFVHIFIQYFVEKLLIFDIVLSFRISRLQDAFLNFGLKEFLFGGGIVNVDSMYLYLLYTYGFFVYVLLCYAVHTMMKNLAQKGNYKMLSFLTAMFIAGVMESSIVRPEFMSAIIVWNAILYNCQPNKRFKTSVNHN